MPAGIETETGAVLNQSALADLPSGPFNLYSGIPPAEV